MIVFYGLLLVWIIAFEIFRKKEVFVDFLSIFHLFFLFTYIFPTLVFLAEPSLYYEWKFLSVYPKVLDLFIVFLAILVGYLSIVVGYVLASKKSFKQYPTIKFKYGEQSQFLMVLIFFIISLFAFFLYAHGHGGIIDLILSGKDIRAKREHAGIFQYFGYLASGLTLSMLLFYSFKSYSQNHNVHKWAKRLFIVALVSALFYAVGTAGRGNIGMIFVYLVLLYFIMHPPQLNIKTLINVFIFTMFMYLLILYGKSALWTLYALADGPFAYIDAFTKHREWYGSQNTSDGIIQYLVGFFSEKDHPLVSLYVSLSHPDAYQAPRYFLDWPRAFVELIPGISQPEFIVSSTPSGLGRDFFGTSGYVPPGWIAMRIINGGFGWLLIASFISGYLGGWLNKFIIKNWFISPILPGVFMFMALFWNDNIIGIDPFMFFFPNLKTFLIFILVAWMVVLKIQKK